MKRNTKFYFRMLQVYVSIINLIYLILSVTRIKKMKERKNNHRPNV
jgi:hypothetical protein